MTTPFPAMLGFNVQTAKPFTNDRFYARPAQDAGDGKQSFAIYNSVGDSVGTAAVAPDLKFDEVVAELRRFVTVLRERAPV